MAARAKKSSKSRRKTKSTRAGATASARKSGRSKRASASAPAVKRSAGNPKLAGQRNAKTAAASTRKNTAAVAAKTRKKQPARGDSPIARVTRVAKEIAHQATTAVTGGVEAIKEAGESLVDRVTA